MKKLINISLIFLFTLTFVACEKEIIRPINEENQMQSCFDLSNDDDSFTRSHGDIVDLVNDSGITDPDDEEDFEDEDKENITDPDEEEDFEEEEDTSK